MHLTRLLVSGLFALGCGLAAFAQPAPRDDRLLNLSARSRIAAGQSELIAGFVLGGPQSQTVLLRGVGPGLAGFGVADALAQPRLRLYDGAGRFLREVYGWGGDTTLGPTFARTGAFALAPGSADAALVATLAPGTYTLHVAAPAGAGSVLAEIYDAATGAAAEFRRLVNLSARGPVDAANALTGGFVIGGTTPKRVLVRGVGPGLAAFGIATPLADPRLRVFRGGTVAGENDNWSGAEPAAAAAATGAFALVPGSRDAALILTLAPGAYTAQVDSAAAGATVGLALVEVYEVPE